MSNVAHNAHDAPGGHGTVMSYVVGFVLSVICTLIPYYLVVNKILSGTTLQATILVFAFVQMFIQITFFLHIGRGPKPRWNLVFFAGTFGIILMVVCGSIVIINNLHYNMSPSDQTKKLLGGEGISQVGNISTGACQELYTSHIVTIQNGDVSPLQTKAKRCDTLTFVNKDKTDIEITFGTHPKHESYEGESEISVPSGRSKSITLSAEGTYQFHDHLRPTTYGYFIVK